ncbi:histidinol-phosphate transaminase [Leptolyngbya sp. 7M]|uniref:histidinol-phosphate transaminase n=1 Tax=Leptolyngbya sp. 7M TaxID=2812896 RepID=UPI001B8C10BF|nr:histidinol-phosphate transaminase [Leptolyngbya sp. 7M]QYO65328.1 histidinol-phosphate transaminase [Leptolyngbya sp. 7M]
MAFELYSLVRKNIRSLIPYSSARGEYGGDARIFLDANENAFGSPLGNLYNRYPDPLQTGIKDRLAEANNIMPSQIFIGNGSDEAIDLLIRIFCRPGIDNILICPPTYGMYEVAAGINNIAVKKANLTADFQLHPETITGHIDENTKVIFLCSPNNPTGNLLKREAILALTENFQGIVAVDEAYIQYSGKPSLTEKLKDLQNLVVLQTFSKAWGLAGLRVGVAFASEEIVAFLNKVKPPYNVSEFAQLAVAEALQNKEMVQKTIELTIFERKKLETALKGFRCVRKIYPSDANFLLVKVTNAADMYSYLLSERIVVRNRSNVVLCEECLRITIGTPEENQDLIRAVGIYEKSFIH